MRNIEKFRWAKVCYRGHNRGDGTNLRYYNNCVECEERADLIGLTQDEIFAKLTFKKPEKTSEEIAALKCEASKRWNKKNMDKVKSYNKKYQSKPERKELVSQMVKDKQANLSQEERDEQYVRNRRNLIKRLGCANDEEYKVLLAQRAADRKALTIAKMGETEEERLAYTRQKNRERYAKLSSEKKTEIAQRQKEYGTEEAREERKKKQLERNRIKYAQLTPEQRTERNRKQNDRARARKAKLKEQDESK